MFSNNTINAIKTAYNHGVGTFQQVCEAAGLDYYKAGTNPAKKRGTPTTTIDGKVYDFHGVLKMAGVDIVKHERLTAGGERIPAHRSRVEKLAAAHVSFIRRAEEITGCKCQDLNKIDLFLDAAVAAAVALDKKEEKERAAAIEKAKEERANKRAAAAIEKKSDDEKLRIAAAALGLSIEQVKAIQAQTKPAKVTK